MGQAKIAVQLRRSEEAAAKVPGGLSRHKLLLTSLASRGLQLRTDNKICTDYIKQGCDQPEQIADNLFCMKWVLDNTDYSARHQKVISLGFLHHANIALWHQLRLIFGCSLLALSILFLQERQYILLTCNFCAHRQKTCCMKKEGCSRTLAMPLGSKTMTWCTIGKLNCGQRHILQDLKP